MSSELDQLASRALIWRPGECRVLAQKAGISTGFPALDEALQGGGWPRSALIELLVQGSGGGELRLLLPALAQLSTEKRHQLWIGEPWLPFAPGLRAAGIDLTQLVCVHPQNHQQWLWATEQALRSPGCGAVLAWANRFKSRYAELRKLQVAVAERNALGFMVSHARSANSASPAVLRLRVSSTINGLDIDILKQRGARAGQTIHIDLPLTLRKQLPLRERPTVRSASRYPIPTSHISPTVRLDVWQ